MELAVCLGVLAVLAVFFRWMEKRIEPSADIYSRNLHYARPDADTEPSIPIPKFEKSLAELDEHLS